MAGFPDSNTLNAEDPAWGDLALALGAISFNDYRISLDNMLGSADIATDAEGRILSRKRDVQSWCGYSLDMAYSLRSLIS